MFVKEGERGRASACTPLLCVGRVDRVHGLVHVLEGEIYCLQLAPINFTCMLEREAEILQSVTLRTPQLIAMWSLPVPQLDRSYS